MTAKRIWWLLPLALLLLPYGALLAAGMLWLYQEHWFAGWLGLSVATTLAGWWLVRRWQRVPSQQVVVADPDPAWAPRATEAWKAVESLATRVEQEDLPLPQADRLWQVVQEVLRVVAQHYHPHAAHPEQEIPVPYALRVLELAACELRQAFSQNVPGAHILTLGDLRRAKHLTAVAQQLYFLYRVVSFGFSPALAILRELRSAANTQVLNHSSRELKRWAVGYGVRKIGYYAIQLYSGQLVLEQVDFQEFQSRYARQALAESAERGQRLDQEPLRILIVGQVKAGKSSLINALFGETRAAVDVVPRTRYVTPFVLEREGLQRALLFDTAGYGDAAEQDACFQEILPHAMRCDLLLLVLSATSAARHADRQLLDQVRRSFQADPDRTPPPVLAVLTHIDQLRPWGEWSPPYNVVCPSGDKARCIAEALQVTATDLALPPGGVIPVCLHVERPYNVEDALVPAILQALPVAERLKYLRCLRQFEREEYWSRLWQQTVNAGRVLIRTIRR